MGRGPRGSSTGRKYVDQENSERFHDWAVSNPLWLWRGENKVTRPMCGAMFGVNATSIWQWEHGAAQPSKENMTKLVGVLGPDTIERWIRWMSKKPRMKTLGET